jgi:hypothetical protein
MKVLVLVLVTVFLFFSCSDGENYFTYEHSVVFMGDSITRRFQESSEWERMLRLFDNDVANIAVGGTTTIDLNGSIFENPISGQNIHYKQ